MEFQNRHFHLSSGVDRVVSLQVQPSYLSETRGSESGRRTYGPQTPQHVMYN